MRALPALALLLASPAAAEVTASGEGGFAIRNAAAVKASPQQVFVALGQPGSWWNSAHTYTGDAKNMTLDMKAGGCFCEASPKDGTRIEHGRVVLIIPQATLRIHGALGPLQAEGVTGSLSFDVKPAPGGGSEIVQTYVVGGYVRGGAQKYAAIVDQVMAEQLGGLKRLLDR